MCILGENLVLRSVQVDADHIGGIPHFNWGEKPDEYVPQPCFLSISLTLGTIRHPCRLVLQLSACVAVSSRPDGAPLMSVPRRARWR